MRHLLGRRGRVDAVADQPGALRAHVGVEPFRPVSLPAPRPLRPAGSPGRAAPGRSRERVRSTAPTSRRPTVRVVCCAARAAPPHSLQRARKTAAAGYCGLPMPAFHRHVFAPLPSRLSAQASRMPQPEIRLTHVGLLQQTPRRYRPPPRGRVRARSHRAHGPARSPRFCSTTITAVPVSCAMRSDDAKESPASAAATGPATARPASAALGADSSARPIASICCFPARQQARRAAPRAPSSAGTTPARAPGRHVTASLSRRAYAPIARLSRNAQEGVDLPAFGHQHQAAAAHLVGVQPMHRLAVETTRRPLNGSITPAIVFSSVVLPAPLAPSTATTPPRRTCRLIALDGGRSGRTRFRGLRTSSSGVVDVSSCHRPAQVGRHHLRIVSAPRPRCPRPSSRPCAMQITRPATAPDQRHGRARPSPR